MTAKNAPENQGKNKYNVGTGEVDATEAHALRVCVVCLQKDFSHPHLGPLDAQLRHN